MRRAYSAYTPSVRHPVFTCCCAQLVAAPGWSNGRDVVTWAKRIFRAYAMRRQQQQVRGWLLRAGVQCWLVLRAAGLQYM
jgi:hypothetical protein